MNYEQRRQVADYFSPSELVELLDIDTYDLICAIREYNEFIIDDDVLDDLKEIMGLGN